MNKKFLASASGKETRAGAVGINLLTEVLPMCSGFDFHIENLILPYCSREGAKLAPFLQGVERSWSGCIENVRELGVRRKDGTFFAPTRPF